MTSLTAPRYPGRVSVVSGYLTPERAALLAERVAEDDTANHADYVALEELERQTLARRANPNG